jgi:hypothetical protein
MSDKAFLYGSFYVLSLITNSTKNGTTCSVSYFVPDSVEICAIIKRLYCNIPEVYDIGEKDNVLGGGHWYTIDNPACHQRDVAQKATGES